MIIATKSVCGRDDRLCPERNKDSGVGISQSDFHGTRPIFRFSQRSTSVCVPLNCSTRLSTVTTCDVT
jgi:hypothetical protein